ncbi:hypothetical protein [Amycolatopsis sp. A1MSW2902]|uniref:hypothetical protein n=1 Tax=Amycolatopsis sp. A1MSW2902 TaxID=687413 RepID=UPI00307F0AC9
MYNELESIPRYLAGDAGAEEGEWEQGVRAGSVEAFEKLVERYAPAAATIISRRISDECEVERRVIGAFCAAWHELQRPACPHRDFPKVLAGAVSRAVADLEPPARVSLTSGDDDAGWNGGVASVQIEDNLGGKLPEPASRPRAATVPRCG